MQNIETKELTNLNKNVTKELQELILKASSLPKILVINKGEYEVSPLFIPSNSHIIFEEGARLNASIDESNYESIDTRVAGIEMKFYPGILNIIDASNVIIEGAGIINGNGPYWYQKYWGKDTLGGMRKEYDAKGLRAFCDYDCLRPRNILIQNSSHVVINGLLSLDAGFWNIHILYCYDVLISSVNISCKDLNSPSTDGIDIDSSESVVIEDVTCYTNDDSICIKSGRDADGIRVGRPSKDIIIRNSKILRGFGITIGSEVSGGIEDVHIYNISFFNTDCGFRIKSSPSRKGYIKNVLFEKINMENVKYLFNMDLNWNKGYNNLSLPKDFKGEILPHWKTLMEVVPNSIKNTVIQNLTFDNIVASKEENIYSRAFNICGFSDSPMENLRFKNMILNVSEFGKIEGVKDIGFSKAIINCPGLHNEDYDEYDNR